jgi:hypothetical protein
MRIDTQYERNPIEKGEFQWYYTPSVEKGRSRGIQRFIDQAHWIFTAIFLPTNRIKKSQWKSKRK